VYRHFASKDDVLRAVVDQGTAGFAAVGEVADGGRDRPLAERLSILGRAFLDTLYAQVDLFVLFAAEHELLAAEGRLVGFIDLAAAGLGAELAGRAAIGEVRADLDGYLFARSFMGSLVSFVLLQGPLGMEKVHPIDSDRFDVLALVSDGLSSVEREDRPVRLANKAAISHARDRLGPELMAALFRKVAKPLAVEGTPGYFLASRRLVAIDGTHAMLDAVVGPYTTSEPVARTSAAICELPGSARVRSTI
jgi:AcrR family transcriptional regulator